MSLSWKSLVSRKPNIQRLKARQDIDGLIKALEFVSDKDFSPQMIIVEEAATALGDLRDDRGLAPLLNAIDRLKELHGNILKMRSGMTILEKTMALLDAQISVVAYALDVTEGAFLRIVGRRDVLAVTRWAKEHPGEAVPKAPKAPRQDSGASRSDSHSTPRTPSPARQSVAGRGMAAQLPPVDETFQPGEVMTEVFKEAELKAGDVIRLWGDANVTQQKGWILFWWSEVLRVSGSEIHLKDLKTGKEYEHSISGNAPYGVRGFRHPNPRRFLAKPGPDSSMRDNESIRNGMGIIEEAYLVREDKSISARFDAALDQVAAEGGVGVQALIGGLSAGTSVVGNTLQLQNWGDLAWNEFLKKAYVADKLGKIHALDAAAALGDLTRAYSNVEQFNTIVRPSAARALYEISRNAGTHHFSRAMAELVDVFRVGSDERRAVVRDCLQQVYEKVGEPVVDVLSGALVGDADDTVRIYAALILGRCRSANALDALLHGLDDQSVPVARNAASALGKIADARAVDSLIKALEHEHWTVRNNAAISLGEIADRRAVTALSKAAGDNNGDVRKAAEWALGEIKTHLYRELLFHLRRRQSVLTAASDDHEDPNPRSRASRPETKQPAEVREHEAKRPQQVHEGRLQAVYFPRDLVENSPAAPTMTRIEELANEDWIGREDWAVTRIKDSIAELDEVMRIGAPVWLSYPPINIAKVATLSLLMHDHDPGVASTAANALWQLLLTTATPAKVALLERIASRTDTEAKNNVASRLLSDLMTSALGRDLKTGEMESVTTLITMHL